MFSSFVFISQFLLNINYNVFLSNYLKAFLVKKKTILDSNDAAIYMDKEVEIAMDSVMKSYIA